MDKESILEEIITRMQVPGLGHTRSMINGAKTEDCLIVVANSVQAANISRVFGIPVDKFITIMDIEKGKLRGTKKPIVVDHYAIYTILDGVIRNYKNEINEKDAIIKELKYKLSKGNK